jgi:hypothetical protein
MATYDDSKFHTLERVWFGLTSKAGGSGDVPYTFHETQLAAGPMARYYVGPGPIRVKKFGALVLATIGAGEQYFTLYKSGTGGTAMAGVMCTTDSAPWAISSDVTISSGTVNSGSYLTIKASTNTGSTGSVACFIDFVRLFHDDWMRFD